MEVLQEFLETSTIHGISYIASSRSWLHRCAWICSVVAGFTFAGILIYNSSQDWKTSQFTTDISTLPISEASFPRITICPPKHSDTGLNHDLELAGKRPFTAKERGELGVFLEQSLIDDPHHKFVKIMRGFWTAESARALYGGQTQLSVPRGTYSSSLHFRLRTGLVRGVCSITQEDVYSVTRTYFRFVAPPNNKGIQTYPSVTLQLKFHKLSGNEIIQLPTEDLIFSQINSSMERTFVLSQDFLSPDFLIFSSSRSNNLMTHSSLTITWVMDSEVSENTPLFAEHNMAFIWMVNAVAIAAQNNISLDTITQTALTVKKRFMKENKLNHLTIYGQEVFNCKSHMISNVKPWFQLTSMQLVLMEEIGLDVNMLSGQVSILPVLNRNITQELFYLGLDIFSLLAYCPSSQAFRLHNTYRRNLAWSTGSFISNLNIDLNNLHRFEKYNKQFLVKLYGKVEHILPLKSVKIQTDLGSPGSLLSKISLIPSPQEGLGKF